MSMSDIFTLADQFYKLVTADVKSNTGSVVFKLAARETRNSIVKKLMKAKKDYNDARVSLDAKKKLHGEMGKVIDSHTKEMEEARKYMQKAYEVLQNMDLADANEVRYVGDDVGYVKNKKVFRLEADENGAMVLVPFKRKRKSKDENDHGAEEQANDHNHEDLDLYDSEEEIDAEALLASLVDD